MHNKSFKDYNSMGQVISLYYSHVPTNLGGFVMDKKAIKRHVLSIISGTTVGAMVSNTTDSTGAGIATGLAVGGLVEAGLKNKEIQQEIDFLEAQLSESREKYIESVDSFNSLTEKHDNIVNELKETQKRLDSTSLLKDDLIRKNKDLSNENWRLKERDSQLEYLLHQTEVKETPKSRKQQKKTEEKQPKSEEKPKADPKEKQPKAEQKKQKPKTEKQPKSEEKPKSESEA